MSWTCYWCGAQADADLLAQTPVGEAPDCDRCRTSAFAVTREWGRIPMQPDPVTPQSAVGGAPRTTVAR